MHLCNFIAHLCVIKLTPQKNANFCKTYYKLYSVACIRLRQQEPGHSLGLFCFLKFKPMIKIFSLTIEAATLLFTLYWLYCFTDNCTTHAKVFKRFAKKHPHISYGQFNLMLVLYYILLFSGFFILEYLKG